MRYIFIIALLFLNTLFANNITLKIDIKKQYHNKIIQFHHTSKIIKTSSKEISFIRPWSIYIPKNFKDKKLILLIKNSDIKKDSLHFQVLSIKKYQEYEDIQRYFLGFYVGVLLIIILYNIIWYKSQKEKSYLYYTLLHIFLLLFTLYDNNILKNEYLSTIHFKFIIGIPLLCFMILFAKSFLDLKVYYKKINDFLNLLIIAILLLALYAYTTNSFYLFDFPFSVLFIPLIPLGILVYKKGLKSAKYFIIAWGIFICFIFISDLASALNLKSLYFIPLLQIGNIIEAIILSFAISEKVKNIIKQKEQKEKMLIQQSKLASLGDMLANIAHQWRQPLNRVASFIMNMQMQLLNKNDENSKYLLEKLEQSQIQLDYMSNTIEDFKNFFSPDKVKKTFEVKQSINNALKIISPSLKNKSINLKFNTNNSFLINGYEKEFSQVILNLLQNSKDALLQKDIKNKKIEIYFKENSVFIEDNAGGIENSIKHKIFEPYFTTKNKDLGTGLGLYMSKMIIEKSMNGNLKFENIDNKARFIISFK